MSEKILRLLLSELDCVRFKCMACKAVLELRINDLDKYRQSVVRCPHCLEVWLPEQEARHGVSPFTQLRETCRLFRDAESKYQVEFVIPAKD